MNIVEQISEAFNKFMESVREVLDRKIKEVDSWDGSASRYDSTEQYCNACLINVNQEAGKSSPDDWSQSHCMLPVRESGDGVGTYVDKAVFAAAGGRGITAVKKPSDVSENDWNIAVKAAAKKLVSAYGQMDKEPPDSLVEIANRVKSISDIYSMLYGLVQEDYYMHDLFFEDSGEMFIIASSGGAMYKLPISFADGKPFISGDAIKVEIDWKPVEESHTRVFRQADGKYRWVSVSCTSVLNRSGEIDSKALFDSFVQYVEDNPDSYPFRTFYHCGEQFKTGQCDFMARDGDCYITSGMYEENNKLAEAEIKALERDGNYWGESISYAPTGEPEIIEIAGVKIPVYRQGRQIEVSLLPEQSAAALFTRVNQLEVNRMNNKVKDALARLFSAGATDEDGKKKADEFIAQFEQGVDDTNRSISESNLITRNGNTEPVKPAEPVTSDPVETQRDVIVDEEIITELTARAVEGTGIDKVREVVDELVETIKSLSDTVKDIENIAGAITTISDRLDVLERTDDEKHKQWKEDLPRRTTTNVTYRPRQAQDAGTPSSLASLAEQTLNKMPSRRQ